jgi:hypothetical protein
VQLDGIHTDVRRHAHHRGHGRGSTGDAGDLDEGPGGGRSPAGPGIRRRGGRRSCWKTPGRGDKYTGPPGGNGPTRGRVPALAPEPLDGDHGQLSRLTKCAILEVQLGSGPRLERTKALLSCSRGLRRAARHSFRRGGFWATVRPSPAGEASGAGCDGSRLTVVPPGTTTGPRPRGMGSKGATAVLPSNRDPCVGRVNCPSGSVVLALSQEPRRGRFGIRIGSGRLGVGSPLWQGVARGVWHKS